MTDPIADPDPAEPAPPPVLPVALPSAAVPGEDDALWLSRYAQQAYLEYALSVVKGRALPDVADGQKPVQRRILYSMWRMGLGFAGANQTNGAKPVKCARVVGDVLGRFHPHGDQAAYDALVRMAQDFHQRYPLIDGQGNFGSRDGDGAAAMRYTEARLARISSLLLDEVDEGTVDFQPNYDGSTEEPQRLPARLPFELLNGASGIAVGLATEMPSHNLREVAAACVALIRDPDLPDADLTTCLPGPDFPGGAQLISSPQEVAEAYRTGRGSLKLRARWVIEELARGQWQWVITELPPGVSTQKVLEEIEELTNPKVKTGKKALSAEQQQHKAVVLAVLDGVRDESNQQAPVRLVLEPRSRSTPETELITTLLAHTSLECSLPVNLTLIGLDGKPQQKGLRAILVEWLVFRERTVKRRSQHRLDRVLARIHILEGRQLVLLNIDEVIALIRQSDEPKAALIARFLLSDRQAEDILEIRLRQLARLEAIRIEQELAELRAESDRLRELVESPAALKRQLIREIETDARRFGDERRTLIQPDRRAVAEVKVVDEPVTVVVSTNGWVRCQKGWGRDRSPSAAAPVEYPFKPGDSLYAAFECRSTDHFVSIGDNGRVYSVPVSGLPGGRGDGVPVSSLIELEAGTRLVHHLAGAPQASWLLACSGGYGLMAHTEHLVARNRSGKAFLTCPAGETVLRPAPLDPAGAPGLPLPSHVLCVTRAGRLLGFLISELRVQGGGGRGLMLISLDEGDLLAATTGYQRSVRVEGTGRGGKMREETFEMRSLNLALAQRGKKGRKVELGFQAERLIRLI